VSTVDSDGYVVRLDRRLRAGVRNLPGRFCSRHSDYLIGSQQPDGGFPGRDGNSDPYYTHFALQTLHVLGHVEGASMPVEVMRPAAEYVRGAAAAAGDVVDCYCALRSLDILAGVGVCDGAGELRGLARDILRRHHAPGGGYRPAEAQPPSVYHTFLAGLCYEIMDESQPQLEDDLWFMHSCRCPDGSFVDGRWTHRDADAPTGGVNPTAAAVGFLMQWDPDSPIFVGPAGSFLAGMQRSDGGFGVHSEAPISDLLSTFTALFTLAEMHAISDVRLADAARFTRDLSCPDGGFRGARFKDEPDSEYTFYGIGSLAVLVGQLQTEREGHEREEKCCEECRYV
jgi:geranylgeranyl transferase type-2 subunit beta